MPIPPDVTPEFADCFRTLTIAFQPRGLDRDTISVYHSVLKRLAPEDVRGGMETLLQTSKFFPTTGEWFAAAKEAATKRLASVWQEAQPPDDYVSPEEALRIIADIKHRLGYGGPRAMPAVSLPPAEDDP